MVKNVVPCLAQLLAAFNHADWPSAVRPFNLLLRWVGRCCVMVLQLLGMQHGLEAAAQLLKQATG